MWAGQAGGGWAQCAKRNHALWVAHREQDELKVGSHAVGDGQIAALLSTRRRRTRNVRHEARMKICASRMRIRECRGSSEWLKGRSRQAKHAGCGHASRPAHGAAPRARCAGLAARSRALCVPTSRWMRVQYIRAQVEAFWCDCYYFCCSRLYGSAPDTLCRG